MKNKYLILVFTAVFLLLRANNSYALEIHASQLESASLACTDGTKVFGIKENGVISSALLMEKDGFILYYNPEFEDIQHIFGVYCLQNAVVVTGVFGVATLASAFPFSDESPYPEKVGGNRRGPRIEESQGKTTINSYYDDPFWSVDGEDEIIKSVSFYKPFKAGLSTRYSEKVTFFPEMRIANPVEQTVQLSTITTCGDNTVLAYTDKKGASYMSIEDASASINSGCYTSKYTEPLPFIATNSMCVDGETYLFGMQENTLQAAKFYYDAEEKEHLEIIDPSTAPLRPAIGVSE